MSGAAAVLIVTALLTLCGLGLLPVVGLAHSPRELVRRAGLGPLVGMAWAGVVAATLATAGARLSLGGLIGLAVVTCAAGRVRLTFQGRRRERARRRGAGRFELAVAAAGLAITSILGVAALAAYRVKPLAEYDGWAIWGMKARAIAVLGSADPDVFASDAYARLHLEYPLLLPALHALPIQAEGSFSSNTVILQCLAIGVAGLLAIWALFRDRVRPALLLAFVAAIAAMPAFLVQLGTGYADVPLAVLVAAGLGAAARWLVDAESGWLMLATLFFAAAVLTKNEGLLFAVAVYVPLFLAATRRRRPVAVSALAILSIYAPWRAFTAVHDLEAPDYDLSSSFDIPWIAGRLDRVPTATEGLLEQALDTGQFGLLLLVGIAAAVVAVGVGVRPLGLLVAGFAVLSFAGLTWIYVLTPYDVSSYLATNANRIVMSAVVGVAALTPLLIEESARKLSAEGGE